MIDITEVIEKAYLQRVSWTKDAFLATLKAVQYAIRRGVIDWDSGVPENWGTINDGGKALAAVCRALPLAIYRAEAEAAIKPVLDDLAVYGLLMDDWETVEFQIAPDTLLKCFGLTRVPDRINTAGFAAGDLWYATVASA